MFREGVKNHLASRMSLAQFFEASDGVEAVELVRKIKVDLAIIDVHLEQLNGFQATEKLRQLSPGMRIICLTSQKYRYAILKMFQAGTNGYILKDDGFAVLSEAVDCVFQGQQYLSPSIKNGNDLGIDINPANKKPRDSFELTRRETEILQLATEGYSTKEIATKREISPRTVETHRNRIKQKLGISSLPGLTKYALIHGIVSLES
jgi:DNA-binding NarL/FixJ family response regulator